MNPPPEIQVALFHQFHREVAEVTRKYLARGLQRPFIIGALEDAKLAAAASFRDAVPASAFKPEGN